MKRLKLTYNGNNLKIYKSRGNPNSILIGKGYGENIIRNGTIKSTLKGCLINYSGDTGYCEKWVRCEFEELSKGESIDIEITRYIENGSIVIDDGKLVVKGSKSILSDCVVNPKNGTILELKKWK